MSSAARRLALSVLSTILLAGCQLGAGSDSAATVTPGTGRAGSTVLADATAYPAPGTPAVPTAAPPTTAPAATTAPIIVPAAGGPLVGPEWTILYQRDLNADGQADVVAVKLASGITPDATFRQPGFSAYKGPVLEMVVVQAGSDGRPQVQASLSKGSLNSGGVSLAGFSNPAAYMVSVTPGARPLVRIWAINTAGAPQGKLVGLEWNGAQRAYVLFGGLSK